MGDDHRDTATRPPPRIVGRAPSRASVSPHRSEPVHETLRPAAPNPRPESRFLVPLLEQRCDIDGVDASTHMLEACRARCEKRGLTPVLYEQLLEHIDLPRKYGLVIIPAGSFSLLTDQTRIQESLKRIHGLMLPGAKFVLEVEKHAPQPSSFSPRGVRSVERCDGAKIIISWSGHYDPEERISHQINRYEFVKDERLLETEFEDFDLRHYDPTEFRDLLEATGFHQIRLLESYSLAPPKDTGETLVFECSKP